MSGKYEIIYADFPWPYTSFGSARLPYQSMSIECGLGWRRHGLHYQGKAYEWVKTTRSGEPLGASGPRPRLVKPVTESVLAYSTTPSRRTFPLLTESQRQVVFAPKPSTHSRKPGVVRELIVELLGDRPRIELFARERAPGWDAMGDELSE